MGHADRRELRSHGPRHGHLARRHARLDELVVERARLVQQRVHLRRSGVELRARVGRHTQPIDHVP
eukprot:1471277-Heterocapsa_arctica.AAC.1